MTAPLDERAIKAWGFFDTATGVGFGKGIESVQPGGSIGGGNGVLGVKLGIPLDPSECLILATPFAEPGAPAFCQVLYGEAFALEAREILVQRFAPNGQATNGLFYIMVFQLVGGSQPAVIPAAP